MKEEYRRLNRFFGSVDRIYDCAREYAGEAKAWKSIVVNSALSYVGEWDSALNLFECATEPLSVMANPDSIETAIAAFSKEKVGTLKNLHDLLVITVNSYLTVSKSNGTPAHRTRCTLVGDELSDKVCVEHTN